MRERDTGTCKTYKYSGDGAYVSGGRVTALRMNERSTAPFDGSALHEPGPHRINIVPQYLLSTYILAAYYGGQDQLGQTREGVLYDATRLSGRCLIAEEILVIIGINPNHSGFQYFNLQEFCKQNKSMTGLGPRRMTLLLDYYYFLLLQYFFSSCTSYQLGTNTTLAPQAGTYINLHIQVKKHASLWIPVR
jgi:hypothetical protein